jgi:hypothetical protein
MVELIRQKKKTQVSNKKSLVCLVRVLDLLFWCPILVLALGILGFVGKGVVLAVRQLGVEKAGGF